MKITNEDLKLEIYHDVYGESPRDWDNVGTMVCWHKKYTLGDKHQYSDPQDFIESEDAKNAYVILPLYLYDHSFLKISTECFIGRAVHAEWDSGQVGFIYITEDKVGELTKLMPTEENKEKVSEILKAETALYNSYLEGNIYGYKIENVLGEDIDSCGGFYGENMKEILDQMKDTAGKKYDPLFDKMQSYLNTLQNAMT